MAREGALINRMGARIRDAGYVRKWIVLGDASSASLPDSVPSCSQRHLGLATRFFLVGLGGYQPPSPLGEGATVGSAHFTRPWAIPLVVGLGGLGSPVLSCSASPRRPKATERTPRSTRSTATRRGSGDGCRSSRSSRPRSRSDRVGPPDGGPTAQISAGFGSLLARRPRPHPGGRADRGRRRHRFGDRSDLPCAAGGCGARSRDPVSQRLRGGRPDPIRHRLDYRLRDLRRDQDHAIFGFLRGYHFDHPVQLGYFALIGLLFPDSSGSSRPRGLRVTHLAARAPGSRMVKPTIAGVLVGLMGLASRPCSERATDGCSRR